MADFELKKKSKTVILYYRLKRNHINDTTYYNFDLNCVF